MTLRQCQPSSRPSPWAPQPLGWVEDTADAAPLKENFRTVKAINARAVSFDQLCSGYELSGMSFFPYGSLHVTLLVKTINHVNHVMDILPLRLLDVKSTQVKFVSALVEKQNQLKTSCFWTVKMPEKTFESALESTGHIPVDCYTCIT